MKQNLINNQQLMDLKDNPYLRNLLIDYCLMQYEQDAIIDEEHLWKEYYYLKRTNGLRELNNFLRLRKMWQS